MALKPQIKTATVIDISWQFSDLIRQDILDHETICIEREDDDTAICLPLPVVVDALFDVIEEKASENDINTLHEPMQLMCMLTKYLQDQLRTHEGIEVDHHDPKHMAILIKL